MKNVAVGLVGVFCLLGGLGTYYLLNPTPPPAPRSSPAVAPPDPPAATATLPKLPETDPPPGLPIVPWGKRGHFPVIRNPRYASAAEGDRLLAHDEPVLGLVLDGQARAYSTNQLNEHEMVIDDIAGTPVLVTY